MAGGVSAKDIYEELLRQGASTVQAVGIMANMINESGLNPEAVNPAGPQAGVGLIQWETTYYPGAAHLVTGNARQDMVDQVRFLAQTGGFRAAEGTNAGQSAGNFAANYERCKTCQAGGEQYQSRVENTLTIAGWIKTGKWPQDAVGGGARTGPGAIGTQGSTPTNTPDCAWKIDLNIPLVGGNICLVTKSEVRAVLGAALLLLGAAVGITGLALLMAAAGQKVGGPVGQAAVNVSRKAAPYLIR